MSSATAAKEIEFIGTKSAVAVIATKDAGDVQVEAAAYETVNGATTVTKLATKTTQ